MVTLVAQVAPERSTQYAALASALAPHELTLSPLGERISGLHPVEIAGHPFLRFELPALPGSDDTRELGLLAMIAAYFEYFDRVGDAEGPFLRPLDAIFRPLLPAELLTARRYRGKTNESLTRFMLNIARHASAYAGQPWSDLRVFDPLAGGGTTLFAALLLGAEAAGVEKVASDAESTATFLEAFLREERISSQTRSERLRKLGHRWSIDASLPKGGQVRCLVAHGDTADSIRLLPGYRPHLVVTDLPYGIQHTGALVELLRSALPVWSATLAPGGALAFAWDATHFGRPEMVALVSSISPLAVLQAPPYDSLAHRVDRVIKRRDILVARRTAS